MRFKTAFILSLLICWAILPHSIVAQSQMQQLNGMLAQMSLNSSFDSEKFNQIALLNSSEQQRFLLYAKLRTYYCEKYLTENDIPLQNVDDLINSFFPLDNRLGYFTFCTERQLINHYTDGEFNYFSQNVEANKSEYDNQRYVLDLYSGLSLYKHNCAKGSNKSSIEDYSRCADYLDAALSYKPNDSLYPILSDSLDKSRRYDRLFYLECYRQYDRDSGSLLKTTHLYLIYRRIKSPKKSFAQLCKSVQNDVLTDTVNSFKISSNHKMSALGLTAEDIKGQSVSLIKSKPHSQNTNNTIVLFFSVTCHNCIDEMNTLSKMTDALQQRNINIVGVYTMFNNPQTAYDELQSFQTAHNYLFPTFIDPNRSSISSKYGITSVPSIMLVRDDGSLAGLGSLNHYGHLQEKFSALFSLFD